MKHFRGRSFSLFPLFYNTETRTLPIPFVKHPIKSNRSSRGFDSFNFQRRRRTFNSHILYTEKITEGCDLLIRRGVYCAYAFQQRAILPEWHQLSLKRNNDGNFRQFKQFDSGVVLVSKYIENERVTMARVIVKEIPTHPSGELNTFCCL